METPHYSDNSEDDDTASITALVALTSAGEPKSTDQSYRDNIKAIKAYMGWTSLPSVDSDSSGARNPFQNKPTVKGRLSVKFPIDPWIVEHLKDVNDEVAAGYAGKNSDSLGITQNQFVRWPME